MVGTTKAYSGLGADIVMESITLIDPVVGVNAFHEKAGRSQVGFLLVFLWRLFLGPSATDSSDALTSLR